MILCMESSTVNASFSQTELLKVAILVKSMIVVTTKVFPTPFKLGGLVAYLSARNLFYVIFLIAVFNIIKYNV